MEALLAMEQLTASMADGMGESGTWQSSLEAYERLLAPAHPER